MNSCTDPLDLNKTKLFKDLKSGLSKGIKDTRNILEIRDDILFVWHPEKTSILTLNINTTREKNDTNYQTLIPIDPPIFEVTHLVINETVTQIAVWGDLGIIVVELPKRWGKEGNFQGGKGMISCMSQNLNACCSQLSTTEIRQARWHPGSASDSHLVVLTSENIFQLYECEMGSAAKIIKTWKVGPSVHSPSKIPNIASLGETAVDFDFSSPTIKNDYDIDINVDKVNWKQIEWPILVLKGNGDVLIVKGNILMGYFSKTTVLGSLSMYPEAVDNYGLDSCSIMCLQTTPTIVVIASCTGKLYHAILLNERYDDDDKKTWSESGSTFSLHTPDEALYVYECIELELGLFYTDIDKKYNCPIYLHSDKGNKARYFCSHNAGIHVINVPMVLQLEEYVNSNEESSDLHMPSLSKQSSAHYLVSTRTKFTSKEESTPVLGFGLLQEPCILIALLHTGVVVDLSVIGFYYTPKIQTSESLYTTSKTVIREDFITHIKKLLARETSQPITKLGLRKNLTNHECLEFLYHSTNNFRNQYFVHHDKVKEELGKKARTLKALKNHQLIELENLSEMKRDLQENAENLAEKYEDIKDKQENLVKRSEEVLRLVNLKEPFMNSAERAEASEIIKMSEKVKDLNIRLEQLKKKKESNQKLLNGKHEIIGGKAEVVLKQSQIDAVTSNLTQMGTDISELISRIKTLQENVGL